MCTSSILRLSGARRVPTAKQFIDTVEMILAGSTRIVRRDRKNSLLGTIVSHISREQSRNCAQIRTSKP
jgi:hypothetical protein